MAEEKTFYRRGAENAEEAGQRKMEKYYFSAALCVLCASAVNDPVFSQMLFGVAIPI
jgi:hypothetical protein